jgi:hypothetical protein
LPLGTTAPFEILTIDLEKKRIGVALVADGSTQASCLFAAHDRAGRPCHGQGRAS